MESTIHHHHEKRTRWVVIITAITMVFEVIIGILSGSMALLADGIHMGSHVLAIGLSWLAYVYLRKSKKNKKFSGDSDKILALSGYTSGIILLGFAILILIQALQRFYNPVTIIYWDAIFVAIVGLMVNIASAILLHHDHEHSDYNIKAAYLHVIADALTSLSAIIGLVVAMIWDIAYLDTIAALISSIVIIKWSIGLLKGSGKILLEISDKAHTHDSI